MKIFIALCVVLSVLRRGDACPGGSVLYPDGRSDRDARAADPTTTARPSTAAPAPKPPGVYSKAAVATDYGRCSDMSRDILNNRGSAVDAAITATLCLGVASPQSSGLGGGLFMVIYNSDGSMDSINANEAAPAASHFDMFVDNTEESRYGARAVSVPGELAGLWEAHKRYGVLPWEQLVDPVIRMAENGFPLAWHTDYTLKQLRRKWKILRDLYTWPNGTSMTEGHTITAPAGLVQTLRAISTEGKSAFYQGEVGQKLVQDIQDQGGIITMEDLSSYSVSWLEPSVLNLKGSQRRVLAAPVPSSGDLTLFTVRILDECDLASVDFSTTEGKVQMYHNFIEAGKFAFAFRRRIGDLDSDDVRRAVAGLSSSEHARRICSKINADSTSSSSYYTFNELPETGQGGIAKRAAHPETYGNEDEDLEDEEEDALGMMVGDTSHLSVISANGDAVSLTTSLGRYFGSRTFSNQTGMFLNGHMENFYYNGRSGSAWEANKLIPGNRAMSAMGPSIITAEDGTVKGVIGSSGGLRIISTNAWVILRALWGNEALSEMIDAPRVYVQSTINIYYEEDFPQELVQGLEAKGHTMRSTGKFSAAQGILLEPGSDIQAHSDRRKHGYPAGY